MAIEKIDKGSRQYFCNFMLCGGLYGGTCTSPEIETEPLDDLNEIAGSILNKAASITENGTVKVNAMFGSRPNIYKCFHGTLDCLKGKCQGGDTENYVAGELGVLTPRTLTFTVEETEVRDTDVDDAEVQSIWTNSSLSFSEEGKKANSGSTWDSVSDTVFDDSHTDFPQSNNAVEATENDNTTHQDTLIDRFVPVPPKEPAPKRAFYRFRRCQLQEKIGLYAKPLCAPHELHTQVNFASSPLGSSPTLENHPETTDRASDDDVSRESSIKHSKSPVDVGWEIINPYLVRSEDPQEIKSAGAEKESTKEESTKEESTIEESTKESTKEESTKENTKVESTKEESTKESTKEESTKESTNEESAKESTKESTKEESTKENTKVESTKEESTKEESTKESTKEESTKEESTKEESTKESTKEESTKENTKVESTKEESTKEESTKESTKEERPTPNPIRYPVLPPVGLTPSYFPVNKHHLPQLTVPRKIRAGRLPCRPVGLRSLQRVPKDRNFRQMKASAEVDWKILEKTPLFMKSSLGSTPFLRT